MKISAMIRQAAITVDISDYYRSHLKRPSGRGGWLFAFEDPKGKNVQKLDLFNANGTYAEAVAKVKEEAKRRGVTIVYTMS